jgi:cation-dependent mannose-6-phosphate receptor
MALYRQQNSELVFRGRKLVLNYTGGSLCDTGNSKRDITTDLTARKLIDGDDDDDDNSHKKPAHKDGKRRKSTIISLLCEREPLAIKSPKVAVAFVGASEDQCTYFFEARSSAACAGIETTPQQLGPGGVFGVMCVELLFRVIGLLLTWLECSLRCWSI